VLLHCENFDDRITGIGFSWPSTTPLQRCEQFERHRRRLHAIDWKA